MTPVSPGGLGKRLFIGLFSGSLIVWTVGNGLLPLLPVYASQLGADSSSIGYFLSFTYLALAAGTLAAGWLSDKLQRRKVSLVIATAVSAPAAWMIGQANNIWSLILFSATVFFLGGVGLTLTSIFCGTVCARG